MSHRLIMVIGLTIAITPVQADQPTFNLPGRRFTMNDRLVSTSVFQWYTVHDGQLSGPWRPLEGRANWTGTTEFWIRQIKDIMDANIDVMYVHLIPYFDQQRINLFVAMSQLRAAGYEVPKAVPFLDAAITWNGRTIDLATTQGKDDWVNQYIRYYNQYFGQNPDTRAIDFIGIMDNRVMIDTWTMGITTNRHSLTRQDVESRLAAAFGTVHGEFNNNIYQIATAFSDSYPSWCDELVYQFCTNSYFLEWNGSPQVRSYTVKGGYWDQNIRNPGTFLARNGGTPYINAWNSVLNDSTQSRRVYIESWNEYDEGSGIYSADPGPPYIIPPNPNTDIWSNTNNPREYIDTTAVKAAQFNGLPARSARCLDYTLPLYMRPGQSYETTITMRNEGNNEWSSAGGYKLALYHPDGPTLQEWTFDTDAQGWALVRNAFGTSGNTTFENGEWNAVYGHTGGGLRTRTGGINSTTYSNGASTAWAGTFHLDQPSIVQIRFKWRLFFPGTFESDEHGEARFEVNNQRYGVAGQSYLARFSGGTGQQDTGWQDYAIDLALAGPANHTIEIGGWNNKKTAADEYVDVYLDNISVTRLDTTLWSPNRLSLDDSDDEIPIYGGIFRGRPKTFPISLTAPATPGLHHLRFQMMQEGVALFGDRVEVSISVGNPAGLPDPADGAVDIDAKPTLTWAADLLAAGHRLYFGTDAQAVADADPTSPEYVGEFPIGGETWQPAAALMQGVTYYWRVDELCSGYTIPGTIWRFTVFIIPGDFDQDLDVDLEDFGFLQSCYSGSGQTYRSGCARADLDGDGDVDQSDFQRFKACLSGPNRPSGC